MYIVINNPITQSSPPMIMLAYTLTFIFPFICIKHMWLHINKLSFIRNVILLYFLQIKLSFSDLTRLSGDPCKYWASWSSLESRRKMRDLYTARKVGEEVWSSTHHGSLHHCLMSISSGGQGLYCFGDQKSAENLALKGSSVLVWASLWGLVTAWSMGPGSSCSLCSSSPLKNIPLYPSVNLSLSCNAFARSINPFAQV